jgi:hypothetical protein
MRLEMVDSCSFCIRRSPVVICRMRKRTGDFCRHGICISGARRLNNLLSRQEWCQEVDRRAHERRSVTLGLLGKHLQYIRDTE